MPSWDFFVDFSSSSLFLPSFSCVIHWNTKLQILKPFSHILIIKKIFIFLLSTLLTNYYTISSCWDLLSLTL
jgi:hypothetical protein